MRKCTALLGAGALAISLSGTPIAAQSVNDYRLPGATSTPAPASAQGPVDSSEPVVRQAVPSPSPSPQPSAAAPAAVPLRTAPAPRRAPAAGQAAPRAQPAAPLAAPSPQPSASTAASVPTPAAPALPAPAASRPQVSSPALQPLVAPTLWPWLAAALALAAATFAALWWRSRNTRPGVIEFERPVPAQPPAPAPAAPPSPPRHEQPAAPNIEIVLEAQRLTASLMATTLSYRLRLTNRGKEALTTLAIEGDMVSAHASLPPDQQIASPAQRLELRHAAVNLAPGGSTEFSGDLRLALAEITPIRAGDGAYFVPLARLRIETSTHAGEARIAVQTFVIGELAETADAPLRPFRLDQGPRTFSRLGQRAVD